jgi:P4 family phage/plasmid primase-like protien
VNDIQRYFEVCGFAPDDLIGIGTQQAGSVPRFKQYPVADAPRQIGSRPANANVWVNACPMRPWPTTETGALPTRGTAADVTRVTALWADLDVASGTKSLPTFEAAWQVINGVSELVRARPVVVVMSGHGLQPRWRLDEPWANDQLAVESLRDFGRLVQLVAERHGGNVDSVFDLPRILRAPGTVNNKVADNPITVTMQFPAANQEDRVELWALQDAIDDYLTPFVEPVPSTAPRATSVDLARGSKWLQGALTGIAGDLEAAQKWAPGQTDDRGRGWEKLTADVAGRLASLAKAEFTPLTEDEAHAFLLQHAPRGDGWSEADIEKKWRREWAQAEPAEAPIEKKVQSDDPLADNYVAPRDSPGAPDGDDVAQSSTDWPVFAQTDKGYAARLARRYAHTLRYSPKLDTWLRYEDGRWIEDKQAGIKMGHDLTDVLYELEGSQYDDTNEYQIGNRVTTERREFARWCEGQEATSKVKAASDMLKGSGMLNVDLSEFDSDPMLINAANCVVNLRTGEMYDHSPAFMMRKKLAVAYDPDAKAPEFEAFLRESLPNEELLDYLQRIAGYSLSGVTNEQVAFMHRGPTASGKSTFIDLFAVMMGEYARPMPDSLLLHTSTEAHPTGIAGLEGCRFVSTDETPQGARWDEALLKRLTGESQITARGMHQDFRDFRLVGKAHIITNYPPHLTSDAATHRRLRLMPWDNSQPEGRRDKELKQRIIGNELPGVLAWAVRGALEWQRVGLGEPADAAAARMKYFAEEDEFGEWLDENTVDTGENGFITPTRLLYQDYRTWVLGRGGSPMVYTTFGKQLEQRGRKQGRTAKARGWRMALQTTVDAPQDPLESSW